MSTVLNTIEVDAGIALDVIRKALPYLETFFPAAGAAAGPAGLAIAAAAALLPLLKSIPTGGVISDAEQAALLARIMNIIANGFQGPQWQVSTAPPAK